MTKSYLPQLASYLSNEQDCDSIRKKMVKWVRFLIISGRVTKSLKQVKLHFYRKRKDNKELDLLLFWKGNKFLLTTTCIPSHKWLLKSLWFLDHSHLTFLNQCGLTFLDHFGLTFLDHSIQDPEKLFGVAEGSSDDVLLDESVNVSLDDMDFPGWCWLYHLEDGSRMILQFIVIVVLLLKLAFLVFIPLLGLCIHALTEYSFLVVPICILWEL